MRINENYVTDVAKELISTRSENPARNERIIAERVDEIFRDIGIPCTVQTVSGSRANAVGILEGVEKGPVLVLNGHLDTVPAKEGWVHSPYEGTVESNRLYGLGSVDMKGGIASMIAAARAVKEAGCALRGSLILSFVADEERTNAGVLAFLEKYKPLDYAVVGEPTSLNLVNSHRGVARFRVTVRGRAGHASDPAGGVNAIYRMNRAIDRMRERADSYGYDREKGPLRPSLSVTQIRGGTAENIIPDLCEIIVDRRTAPGESMEEVEGEMKLLLDEIGRTDSDFQFTCERFVGLESWKTAEDSRLLQYGKRAYERCFKRQPILCDLGATCEAALFAREGVETLIFGPGDMARAHTIDEWVQLDHLVYAGNFYTALIEEILVK